MEKSETKEPGAMIVTLNVAELKALIHEAAVIALQKWHRLGCG